jgi:beta-glucanase (GH16 family)
MEWDEQKIRISVDDQLLNELDIDKAANGDGSNAFRQPMYMLLNLPVGGVAGGDPAKTEFPGRYEVDWVRVYQ